MNVLKLNEAFPVLWSPLEVHCIYQVFANFRPRVALRPPTEKQKHTLTSKPESRRCQQQNRVARQQQLSRPKAHHLHLYPFPQHIRAMQDPIAIVAAPDDAITLAAPASRAPEQHVVSKSQHSLSTAQGTEPQDTQDAQPGVLATNEGASGLVSQDQPNSNQQQDQEQCQQGKQQQQQQQQQRPRPTHFVSLRVSQYSQVVSCIEHVQQQLVAAAPELQPCLLEPVTAHMTVMVMLIQTQDQEDLAAAVMASLPDVLQQQGLGQLTVTLQGLSTFRNQVLYLDVAPGQASEQLQRLGEAVISHFHAQGSEIVAEEPGRGFTPHVTVAKTSRLLGGRHKHKKGRSNTKIPKEAWSELAEVSAGDVLLTELQICSMQGRKANEYYKVTHSIELPDIPAPPAAAAAPPAAAAAAAAAVAGMAPGQPEIAALNPVAGAKRRFKQLLDALVCRRRARLAHVDHDEQQPEGSAGMQQ